MTAKNRLGDDPLSFIVDTRQKAETPAEKKTKAKTAARKTQEPAAEKWTRASFTLRESHLKKLRLEALRDGKPLKDILDAVLTAHYRGKTITVKE